MSIKLKGREVGGRRATKRVGPPLKDLAKGELIELLKVSRHTVDKWIQEGAPKRKKGRAVMFNRQKLADWMQGKPRVAAKYVPLLLAEEPVVTRPVSGDTQTNFEDALARARFAEESSFEALQQCSPAERFSRMDQYMKAGDHRRKLEKDWAGIQQSLGQVVGVAEVETAMRKVATEVRDAMLAIPSRITPTLVGKVEQDIYRVLTDEIKLALRALAVGVKSEG